MEVFLNDKIGYNEKRKDNYMNVELESDTQTLQSSDMTATLDEFKQYLKESDNSKKYRLICSVKPICSNVLFNMISEVVYKEGTDECKFYGTSPITVDDRRYLAYKNGGRTVTRSQAISDTGFSHKECGNLTYHCGLDIFDNHYLRAKKFFVVNRLKTSSKNRSNFNTFKDYLRDKNGKEIDNEHLYTIDEVYGFNEAIQERLIERDGWFGFYNPTTLDINNVFLDAPTTNVTVNKCMNANKANEFIDMYPDRSLYSFVPKYNKGRGRLEKNWEYCLTYPYASDKTSPIVTGTLPDGTTVNALICRHIATPSSASTYMFKSQLHNTLSAGDTIHLYMVEQKATGSTFVKIEEHFKVSSVGSGIYDSDLFFSIDKDDLDPYLNGRNISDCKFRFAKVINGMECEYYFRKFRYFPNYSMSNVLVNDDIDEKDINECSKVPFRNNMGRLAFAKTSYGDDVVEIVFTDDININSLRDNLGREVSEIFLTLVKTNYGHEKWYEQSNYTDPDIEFSHCFGKVSSALDLDGSEDDYNIHKIHDITAAGQTVLPPYIPQSCLKLESDITISGTTATPREFLGDVVEFAPYTIEETVLEDVYHRFNTAQREIVSDEYKTLRYTEITDDGEGPNTKGFTTQEIDLFVSDTVGSTATTVSGLSLTVYPANLFAEGYFYKPHYRIPLYEYNDEIQQGEDIEMVFSEGSVDIGNNRYILTASRNYYLNVGDRLFVYRYPTRELTECEVKAVSGTNYNILTVEFSSAVTMTNIDRCLFYKPNSICPVTAYRLHDGSGRYIWRDRKSTSDVLAEKGMDAPTFTNGAHYLNADICFYLKRQDPSGNYGITENENMPTSVLNVTKGGKFKDISKYDYEIKNNEAKC